MNPPAMTKATPIAMPDVLPSLSTNSSVDWLMIFIFYPFSFVIQDRSEHSVPACRKKSRQM
jgi:hypothetical protein